MTKVPPFMGEFADADMAWAVDNGVQRRVSRGEAIIEEGKHPDHVFVVLDGAFVVSSVKMSEPTLQHLGPGELAGEMSFINQTPPAASVLAETDSVVLCVPRDRLREKLESDTGFASRFMRVVSEFTIDRLFTYGHRRADPPPPRDPLADLRVYELIEKMLRGDFS